MRSGEIALGEAAPDGKRGYFKRTSSHLSKEVGNETI
jgi:hypothetical protein